MANFRSNFLIVLFFLTSTQVNAEWLELISDGKTQCFHRDRFDNSLFNRPKDGKRVARV
ncbi:MAG: hypothetical protein CM15mP58_03950 [Burkholderiaceae bacterium]|nr:MAG: hypothetical protein CM15mP58_03950 [Burkholderiaceae bacterium]